ncbi:MAG: hypothetical protein ACYCPO_03130 [Acidobacteriaceae bacterium]
MNILETEDEWEMNSRAVYGIGGFAAASALYQRMTFIVRYGLAAAAFIRARL